MLLCPDNGFLLLKVQCLNLGVHLLGHLLFYLLSVFGEIFLHPLFFIEAVPLPILENLLSDMRQLFFPLFHIFHKLLAVLLISHIQ